jgi:hypothetical protein
LAWFAVLRRGAARIASRGHVQGENDIVLALIETPIFLGFWLLLIFAVLPIWFLWRALDRAGLVGAMALLSLIPFGIFVVMGVLAFAPWPNLPEKQDPRLAGGAVGPPTSSY